MYRRNYLPLGPMPIPISPFGGIPIAGVPYGFPIVINRPNNNNYNNGDIDINIVKKQNGSMLTPADTNYLKTKIYMLQIIFNIILNNLCFKNSNNNNQLVNQIKNDIASNATVSNHLSDLCLSGSNKVAAATAAAIPSSVTQAANAVAAVAIAAAAVPTNTLISVLTKARAEFLKTQKIKGVGSLESDAATVVYTAIEQAIINYVKSVVPTATPADLKLYINQAIIAFDTNISGIINGVAIPVPFVLATYITTLDAAVNVALATAIGLAIAAFTTAVPVSPIAANIIAAVTTTTPITPPAILSINTAANNAVARYPTTPAIVRKNPANQCFEPVFDDFKLHGLISSMRNNNFLRKACIYNSSRNGIDSNRIKINFAGGANTSNSSNSSNTQDENFNFINLLNILKEKDQSPDKTAILCVQTNGKLKCSNMKKKESTTECEFCERWTRERNMFRSVLKDLLEASDFNNTFDLMSASAYLLPSAIMDQKQYEQFYTAIDAYKKAKKAKK